MRGVSFAADPGAITLLVGNNGAGTSTIMKVLCGLIRDWWDRAHQRLRRCEATHRSATLQQIPTEAANKTSLAAWWMDHAGAWFIRRRRLGARGASISGRRMQRWEE